MITEETRTNYTRIGDVGLPSVSKALIDVYGCDLCKAETEECLVLMETIAFSLRVGGSFSDNLRAVLGDGPDMPRGIYTPAGVGRNEGLKLLAVLQVAIVEGYAALAFTK